MFNGKEANIVVHPRPNETMLRVIRQLRLLISRPFRAVRKRSPKTRSLALATLVTTALLLAFGLRTNRLLIGANPLPTSHAANDSKPHVTVWHHPLQCTGSHFHTGAAKHSCKKFPSAVLRDAVIDRRPSVSEFFRRTPSSHLRDENAVRITLFLTVHNSARLTDVGSSVHIDDAHAEVIVEYTLHSTSFLQGFTKYSPGKTTVHGREITEWQVGLLIQAREPSERPTAVAQAFATNALLTLNVSVTRYEEARIGLQTQLSLSCVKGYDMHGLSLTATCAQGNQTTAVGGLLVSGSALYGVKKKRPKNIREIAHFAARALAGPLRFDLVVMSVVSDFSMSDLNYRCDGEQVCEHGLWKKNFDLLNDVSDEIERELQLVGLGALADRVLLVPSCTLGSDASASEWRDACTVSKHYGQYWATFYTYAALAPFFKVRLFAFL